LDAWLHELEQTHLIFKGYLHTNDLLVLSHHNSKSMMVNGEVTFNGVTKPYTIEFNLFEIANPGVLYVNNGQDYFDRVNVNMHLAFYPKDFNIDKKHHHYKSSVSIAIYRGYLNEFKPGMEYLTKSKN
jgi:hypothetical protein